MKILLWAALTALLLPAANSALAQAQDDKCLPVLGNWSWTPDEVNTNRRVLAQIRTDPAARDVPLVSINHLRKYSECRKWAADHQSMIFYELLRTHDALSAVKRLFDLGAGMSTSYVAGGIFSGVVARTGVGTLLTTSATNTLDDWVFGDWEEQQGDALEAAYQALRSENPGVSDGALIDRLKDRMMAWGSSPQTVKWMDDVLMKFTVRRLLTDRQPKPVANPYQALRRAVTTVDAAFASKKPTTDLTIANAKAVAESASAGLAVGRQADWSMLDRKYKLIQRSLGSAAPGAISDAVTDAQKRNSLGLTREETEAIADELKRRQALSKGVSSAKEIGRHSAELATLSTSLGWKEGAKAFTALGDSSVAYSQLLQSLAGSTLGPPGPWQLISAANAVFSLGNSLSRAFGGGGKKDDGLAKALEHIFAALRSIDHQLQGLRQEQRENFEYAQRHLEVLVELASNDALAGVQSCRRMSAAYERWVSSTGLVDLRKALSDPNADQSMRLRATQCMEWLNSGASIPFMPNGINVLFKQRLETATKVAKFEQESAGFKNRGFLLAEKYYPLLLSLLDDEATLSSLQDRTFVYEPIENASELGERMLQAGYPFAKDWRLGDYMRPLLSSATVAAVATSALVLKPAAAFLDDANSVGKIDASFGTFAAVERELFALVLVALAQERLMSGSPIAERVDSILEESDLRQALAARDTCAAVRGANLARCAVDTGVSTKLDIEKCEVKPNPQGVTWCSKWGLRQFKAKTEAAASALKAFPTLRQNVLLVRLWRLGGRERTSRTWAPRYKQALGLRGNAEHGGRDAGALLLSRMFNGLRVVQLSSAVLNEQLDAYINDGVYFTRLAGACDGIRSRDLLGIARCVDGACNYEIGRDDEGEPRIFKRGTKQMKEDAEEDAQACVMAAMPDPTRFADASLLRTGGSAELGEIAAKLSMSISFDEVFRRLTNDDRAALVGTLRPLTYP